MQKECKIVKTYDSQGKENGYLIEITKQGKLTTSYLSATFPGSLKGYHLHTLRSANYFCVRGKITVICYYPWGKEVFYLDSKNPTRLYIGPDIPTALLNESTEVAEIINYPNPPYDPDFKEQIEFTQEELDLWMNTERDFSAKLKKETLARIKQEK